MYELVVFLHVTAVFGFLLAHGTSFSVAFQLRGERNVDRIRALLDVSFRSLIASYIALLLLLITGVIAGFMGNWWGRGWIWTAIVVLVTVFIAMGFLGSGYFTKVRQAVGVPPYKTSNAQPLGSTLSEAELAMLLESTRPVLVAVIGVVGLVIVLWLMMFKPF